MGKFKTIQEEVDFIKKQMNIVTEEKRKFEYGCVLLKFDFPEIGEIHDLIDSDDLYEEEGQDYGLEKEPHLTLLFGLKEGVPTGDIKKVLDEYIFDSCTAHNPSVFKNELYDVLKFDIKSSNAHEINEKLRKFPYVDEHPNYRPHMTIAYLKPGKGLKYANMLKGKKYFLPPKLAVYSKPDETRDEININID